MNFVKNDISKMLLLDEDFSPIVHSMSLIPIPLAVVFLVEHHQELNNITLWGQSSFPASVTSDRLTTAPIGGDGWE